MSIAHSYFGEIATLNGESNVCWEKQSHLNGDDFTICLWADTVEDLKTAHLDKFAYFCQHLAEHDKICRKEMTNELHQDASYMTENLGEVQEQVESPKLQRLIDSEVSIEQFVQAINLTSVSLSAKIYKDFGKAFVTFDYMIDKEYSNQILCVRHDLDGTLIHVAHES